MTDLKEKIELDYDGEVFQVHAKLTSSLVARFESVPQDFMGRAKIWIENLYRNKTIDIFNYYPDRLERVWAYIQNKTPDFPVWVTIAEAAPALKGFYCHFPPMDESSDCLLTIKSDPSKVQNWKLSWMRQNAESQLAKYAGKIEVGTPHLLAAKVQYLVSEAVVKDRKIRAKAEVFSLRKDVKYLVRVYEDTGEIIVIFYDYSLQDSSFRTQVYQDIKKAQERLAHAGWAFVMDMKQNCEAFFGQLDARTLKMNFDLPKTLLVGVGLNFKGLDNNIVTDAVWQQFYCSALAVGELANGERFWPEPIRKATLDVASKLKKAHIISSKAKYNGNYINPKFTRQQTRLGLSGAAADELALKIAQDALVNLKAERRSIQGLTLSVSNADFLSIREKIEKFQLAVLALTKKAQDKDQVYHLNTTFLPLTCEFAESNLAPALSEVEIYDQWINTTVREMIGLRDFKPEPAWICRRLILKVEDVKVRLALEGLKKSGLIEFDSQQNKFICPDPNIKTEPEAKGLNVVKFHQAMMQASVQILQRIKKQEHFFTQVSMATNDEQAQEVKKLINGFMESLLEKEQSFGDADHIYQLNLQFFPLTKKSSNDVA